MEHMKIRLMGQTLAVEVDPDEPDFGAWYSAAGKIKMNASLTPTQQGATLVHEILEAVKSENELRISHSALSVMANLIYAALRDNPELFARIIAGEKVFG